MNRSRALARADDVGAVILVYEGAVIASRLIRPVPRLPAVSDLVWKLPRRARWLAAIPILGYLAWHLISGPQA